MLLAASWKSSFLSYKSETNNAKNNKSSLLVYLGGHKRHKNSIEHF
jgi:hypothetical protein